MDKTNLQCANLSVPLQFNKDFIPEAYYDRIHVCSFDEETKRFVMRLTLSEEMEFKEFLVEWGNKTHITWRVSKTDPKMCAGLINVFWKQYHCQSSNLRTDLSKNPSKKHTGCKAAFTVIIKKISERCRSKDKHLPKYPMIIKGCADHNHGVFCADNLKYKDVSETVREKFLKLYGNGYTPMSALDKHKFDLQARHKENYFIVAADRSLCPDLQWCYRLFNSIKKEEYGLQGNVEELLTSRFGSSIKISNIEDQSIIAVCTPLMQRVHQLWPYSKELIFMDSSGNFDCQQHRVFVLLTHSYAGGLPLGVIISTSENEKAITEGLCSLKILAGEKGFYGNGSSGPNIIITDDSQAEQNAIKNAFPRAANLLCTFHILQAAWRYIWKADNEVKMADKPQLMSSIKKIMYALSKDDMEENYSIAINSDLFAQNPKILHYLYALWKRRELWALCYRKELKLRGNNTNNYVESAMRVLKDKVFHRKKAYNIVHLLEFICQNLEDYYIRKLTDVAIFKNDCNIQKRHLLQENKTLVVTNTENEDIYLVNNITKGTSYTVDTKLGLCTCYVGYNGAPCKHQSAVVQNLNVISYNFLLQSDSQQRNLMHKIANGEDIELPLDFYNPLHSTDSSLVPDVVSPPVDVAAAAVITSTSTFTTGKSAENVDSALNKSEVLQSLREFTQIIERKVNSDADFVAAVSSFNKGFKHCKTDAALLHALHTFARTVGTHSHKNMNVQATSRARRKRRLGGCNRVESGRPSKKSRKEHSYCMKNKKLKKAPHSLNECVTRNVSLGL